MNPATGNVGPSKSAPSNYQTIVPDERTGGQCQRLFNIIFPGGFRRGTSSMGSNRCAGWKLRAGNPWLLRPYRGEVPERPNGRDWKSRRGYRLSRVQIPPSPPDSFPHPHWQPQSTFALAFPSIVVALDPRCVFRASDARSVVAVVRGRRLLGWRIAPAVCLRCLRSSSGQPACRWTGAIR